MLPPIAESRELTFAIFAAPLRRGNCVARPSPVAGTRCEDVAFQWPGRFVTCPGVRVFSRVRGSPAATSERPRAAVAATRRRSTAAGSRLSRGGTVSGRPLEPSRFAKDTPEWGFVRLSAHQSPFGREPQRNAGDRRSDLRGDRSLRHLRRAAVRGQASRCACRIPSAACVRALRFGEVSA